MTNTEILNGLEDLFRGDPSIVVTRDDRSISFYQMIPNIPHPAGDPFMKYDRRFTHTITLYDGSYKAEDLIETFNMGSDKPCTGFKRGELDDSGNYKDRCWNTEDIKGPVRRYMESTGLTRKKPFWTGKRIGILFAAIWIPIIIAAILILLNM